jgi:N-acetylglucosaminyl-diphospho-decaprenol L-rhamnosyltransferase
MSAPGVSVIIVNWNTRDMVLRLLKSLSEPDETGHQLELIVVDNNSSDDSVEAIRRQFPEVTLVAQDDNRGFAGGVNPGVEVATQPLVLLLNSEAETTRASIRESAQYMTDHPEAGILGPRILNPNRTHQSSA